MTVKELIDVLLAIPEDQRHLELIAIDSASGVSYGISCSGFVDAVGLDEAGRLCNYLNGQQYISIHLDN